MSLTVTSLSSYSMAWSKLLDSFRTLVAIVRHFGGGIRRSAQSTAVAGQASQIPEPLPRR